MSYFDLFAALDGPVLNGFEGPGGILRLRYYDDNHYDLDVKFYDGVAGGHAVQVNKEGTIGYLGGFDRTPLFFDPATLEEIKRFSTTHFGPIEVPYESQTHVVFLEEKVFLMAIRGHFYKFHIDDMETSEDLGPHRVALPHALKLSPSGRYVFYGAMDHDYKGYAREFGVFDLQEPDPEKRATVVPIDDTAWHFGVHPTEDIAYAVTECYDPMPGEGDIPFDFNNFSIGYRKNFVWKIHADKPRVVDKVSIAAFLPSHLSSDVVVTGDEKDTVLYNSCASSTVTIVEFDGYKVRHVDERVGFWHFLFHPRLWGVARENLLEAAARIHLFGNSHRLVKALRISRGSLVDGSYGLQLSPDKKLLFSAHKGLNQFIVYKYPEMKVFKRIQLPPARKYFPDYLGLMSDPRLGLHHTYPVVSPSDVSGQ